MRLNRYLLLCFEEAFRSLRFHRRVVAPALAMALPGISCGGEEEPRAEAFDTKPKMQAPASGLPANAPSGENAAIRWAAGLMKERDTNGDGRITLVEFQAAEGPARAATAAKSFANLDADKNGAVTSAEIELFKRVKSGGR